MLAVRLGRVCTSTCCLQNRLEALGAMCCCGVLRSDLVGDEKRS